MSAKKNLVAGGMDSFREVVVISSTMVIFFGRACILCLGVWGVEALDLKMNRYDFMFCHLPFETFRSDMKYYFTFPNVPRHLSFGIRERHRKHRDGRSG